MPEIFVLENKKKGYKAKACLNGNQFTVLDGSTASLTWSTSNKTTDRSSSIRLRDKLIQDEVLQPTKCKTMYQFTRNFDFEKPTPAADIVNGYPTSGPSAWKLERNKSISLKDFLTKAKMRPE